MVRTAQNTESIFLLAENFRGCAVCPSACWSQGQLFKHPSWASTYSCEQNSAWDMLWVAAKEEGNELSRVMGRVCSIITALLLSRKVEVFEHCNQILDFSHSRSDVLDFFVLSALFACFETCSFSGTVIKLGLSPQTLSGPLYRSTPTPSLALGLVVVPIQYYNSLLEERNKYVKCNVFNIVLTSLMNNLPKFASWCNTVSLTETTKS